MEKVKLITVLLAVLICFAICDDSEKEMSSTNNQPNSVQSTSQDDAKKVETLKHLVDNLVPRERQPHIGPPPFVGTWDDMNKPHKLDYLEDIIKKQNETSSEAKDKP
ncbi:unnamed protein product [Bursaphelenchus okinawaensis]|uniref:Uncharacterized protein n=1 Tax=Bursaphelenchus okinawaensis TaxID=465554 RepID=A0A811LL55_9BILA|nr:unnamed protein product [Bursaphelenchus okinawaensis]CAG9125112.1 unnamed protein product [Bursaphelenchus okinawaensis]